MTDEQQTIEVDVPETEESPAEGELELGTDESAGEPEMFSREYVEKLRQENGKYRQRAQRADDLAHRLHRALVEQTGRLADPPIWSSSETFLATPTKWLPRSTTSWPANRTWRHVVLSVT
ncbi:hypothetical protein [Gordonia sp. (in: high G+C Gram-positive bacteria)]|uniref:hypothetical protein n=1 Tax=Gordonia sp. (in: high G+C Gram-positive bacteria) TaxID=84139 RepID=UPI0035277D57